MQLKFYIVFALYAIIGFQHDSVNAKAMIGSSVRNINPGEFNFVVSIKRINNLNNAVPELDHECTGSLISMHDVLTVAHLFTVSPLDGLEILVGSVNLRLGLTYYPAWWVNYEQWASTNNIPLVNEVNDIAIIRLTTHVPNIILPVMIDPIPPTNLYGLDLVVAGWGMSNEGSVSSLLQAASMRVLTRTECQHRIEVVTGREGYVPENVLCSAASPFVITTAGNSGSPVLFLGSLVGVHKAVCPNLGECFHPAQVNIHLAVAGFTDFIVSILHVA